MLKYFFPLGVLGKIDLKALKTVIVTLNKIKRTKCKMPIDFQFLARGQSLGRWAKVFYHDAFF